jgi:hypothetical protein
MQRKATVGSIISATHNTSELVAAFTTELEYITRGGRTRDVERLLATCNAWLDKDEGRDDELGEYLVEDLIGWLGEYAPPYCYFSTHPDDGADFGFWPCLQSINELPKVKDCVDPAPIPGEDYVYVNDRGNVTVYGADGSVLLELV